MNTLRIINSSIVITILLAFCTCNFPNRKPGGVKAKNEKYYTSLNRFSKSMINHFPDKVNEKSHLYESFSPEVGEVGIHLMTFFETTPRIDNYIARYKPAEDSLLVINRFANSKNYGYNILISTNDSIQIEKEFFLGKYPVPNFWSNIYSTDSTTCKLPNDFILYVIEAKPGKFVDNSMLTDGRCMPKKWKNGFSKGIAISEERKIAIYWLVIW